MKNKFKVLALTLVLFVMPFSSLAQQKEALPKAQSWIATQNLDNVLPKRPKYSRHVTMMNWKPLTITDEAHDLQYGAVLFMKKGKIFSVGVGLKIDF